MDARVPVRDKGRLITLAQPGSEVLGVIALVDPDRTAGDSERVALEHANTVLTLELAHLRALAEVELRLRRDLVEELLAGTDTQALTIGPGRWVMTWPVLIAWWSSPTEPARRPR